MKIAIVTSEAAPFIKTGELADRVSDLCCELVNLGHEVDLLLPLYTGVSMMPTKFIGPMRFGFGGRQIPYSIIESRHKGIRVIFFDAPQYFQRSGIYEDSTGEYSDNDERFVFFMRASVDYYFRRDERPDIFHCHDWQTALIPIFLQTHYSVEEIGKTPTLLTIHNIEYQGVFGKDRFFLLDLGWEYFTSERIEFYGSMNFLKAGIVYADLLNTNTREYFDKIQTVEGGSKLDGVVRSRIDRVKWITGDLTLTSEESAQKYVELYKTAIGLKS
jgi:starch synthase